MLVDFGIVLIGCLVIVLLAHFVIRKNIDIAEHFGFSGTFIGLTILSIGTSLPEIMTHIMGSIHILKDPSLYQTVSSLVIGTNIGSDIFQQNFILGIVAILGTVVVLKKNIPAIIGGLIVGAVALWLVSINGLISRWEGAALVIGYLIYLVYLKRQKLNEGIRAKNHLTAKKVALTVSLILIGFVLMALAANWVLIAAESLVMELTISASFFGVLVIGIAAALPELTTALIALKKKRKEMSTGVLIGSNITNPTLALGLGAMISKYFVPNVIVWYDLPIKILGAIVILFFLLKHRSLGKKEAVVLIGMFLLYLILRNVFFPVDI
ncbi:sodium:calcium antiporter [Candidatus Woesearchaeota archaeon]|nr:sodium:calcium antiporter [Candidatus Woesearchaeota archaeon]